MRYRDEYYEDDYQISEDDVRDTYKAIDALTRAYDGRAEYIPSVNHVFYDLFGIQKVGSVFASRRASRRDDQFRVDVFRRIGEQRLIDMILDDDTYRVIQYLVKLHHDVCYVSGTKNKDKLDEAAQVYNETIERLKRQYGIRVRSSVSMISNPLKALRKLNRDYEDDYRIYNDDDDYYYRDYYDDEYDDRRRRRSSRRRREDDDYYYDDSDFVNSILEGVDPDVIKRKASSRKRKASAKTRRSEDYDDDDDFEAVTADTFSKVADSLEKLNDRIGALERDDYYEPQPRRDSRDDRSRDRDDDGIKASIDALARSVKTIAANQNADREDLNNVIDIIKQSLVDDEEEEEIPSKASGGDLIRTTGGINSDTT